MKPIILIGGGGHCVSCIDVVESTNEYKILGILDLPDKFGERICNYKVIGNDDDIHKFVLTCPNFLISVGQINTSLLREELFNKVKYAGGSLPVIISPNAYVSKYAKLEEGSVVMHHALVNANVKVGACCIINTKSLVEHESQIGNFSHISTSAVINGQVKVGEKCFIGSNSVVGNNIEIVDKTVIAAGSQVLKNIKIQGVYIGNPLRKIRESL